MNYIQNKINNLLFPDLQSVQIQNNLYLNFHWRIKTRFWHEVPRPGGLQWVQQISRTALLKPAQRPQRSAVLCRQACKAKLISDRQPWPLLDSSTGHRCEDRAAGANPWIFPASICPPRTWGRRSAETRPGSDDSARRGTAALLITSMWSAF